MGSASAATPGVGTSLAKTTVAQLDIGNDLLSARVLGNDSASSIDPSRGTPEAATVLRPLTVTSGVIDALNVSLPEVSVRTTGAENRQEVAAIDLDSVLKDKLPDALDAVAGTLASGEISPASLAAIVDAVGARSGLNAELADLSAAAGLVSVDAITGALGTDAATVDTDTFQGLDVDTVSALNLGALLDGLGIPLTDLDVATVAGLLEELGLLGTTGPVASLIAQVEDAAGVTLPAPTDAAALSGIVDTVTAADSDAIADLGVCETAGDTLGDLTGGLPTTGPISGLPDVDDGTLCSDALDDLLAALPSQDLLGGLLAILDNLSLLSLDGVEVGINAKATDSVSTSAANVTAAIGAIRVGNVSIPGIDLLATAQALAAKADAIKGQLDDVLGVVGVDAVGDLAGILDVDLLDTTGTGVTKNGEYVQAVANLTGVKVTITPPANLAAIVSGLAGGTSVLEELDGLLPGDASAVEGALTMPNTDAMRALENALTVPTAPGTAALAPAGATNALLGGATLSLASVSGTSNFVPRVAGQATPTPTGGELPRTGTSGNAVGLAALGMVLGALAIGIRRQVLAPVRIDEK